MRDPTVCCLQYSLLSVCASQLTEAACKLPEAAREAASLSPILRGWSSEDRMRINIHTVLVILYVSYILLFAAHTGPHSCHKDVL
jgi:hypothetical protein